MLVLPDEPSHAAGSWSPSPPWPSRSQEGSSSRTSRGVHGWLGLEASRGSSCSGAEAQEVQEARGHTVGLSIRRALQ